MENKEWWHFYKFFVLFIFKRKLTNFIENLILFLQNLKLMFKIWDFFKLVIFFNFINIWEFLYYKKSYLKKNFFEFAWFPNKIIFYWQFSENSANFSEIWQLISNSTITLKIWQFFLKIVELEINKQFFIKIVKFIKKFKTISEKIVKFQTKKSSRKLKMIKEFIFLRKYLNSKKIKADLGLIFQQN